MGAALTPSLYLATSMLLYPSPEKLKWIKTRMLPTKTVVAGGCVRRTISCADTKLSTTTNDF